MRLSGSDKVATMSVILEDKETEEAIAQAAVEQRAEEVEAIEDHTAVVKRAERRAAKKAVESLTAAGVSMEQAKVAVLEKPKIQASAPVTISKAAKIVAKPKRATVLVKSPAKALPKPKKAAPKAKAVKPKTKPVKKAAKKAPAKKKRR